ncbi:hypothetical protein P7K49_029656, partial [Saguinus oedipus]
MAPERTSWAVEQQPASLEKGELHHAGPEEPPLSGGLGRRDPRWAPGSQAFRTRLSRAEGTAVSGWDPLIGTSKSG